MGGKPRVEVPGARRASALPPVGAPWVPGPVRAAEGPVAALLGVLGREEARPVWGSPAGVHGGHVGRLLSAPGLLEAQLVLLPGPGGRVQVYLKLQPWHQSGNAECPQPPPEVASGSLLLPPLLGPSPQLLPLQALSPGPGQWGLRAQRSRFLGSALSQAAGLGPGPGLRAASRGVPGWAGSRR